MDEKKLQQKLIQVELLKEQTKQLQSQQVNFTNQLAELENTRISLSELKNTKEGNDILIPMGGGIYTSGKLGNVKKVLVDVGAGVAVNKNIAETTKYLEKQQKNLTEAMQKVDMELKKIDNETFQINQEIQKELAKKQK